MINTTLFETSFYIYASALVFSIVVLVNSRRAVGHAAFGLFVAGFILHTVALFVRWAESGNVEVAAFEEAEGRVLAGWEWFHIWISHPPWTNLYESLVCFGWGMSLVSIYGIRKFKIPILPVFAISLSLVVMGAASLLINKDISPLVPALQSKWIHLHVTMATICYPAFGLAAVLGIFYLLKVGARTETFGMIIAFSTFLIILAAGGKTLVATGDYAMNVLAGHGGEFIRLTYAAGDASGNILAKAQNFRLPVPGGGIFLSVSGLAFLLAGAIYFIIGKVGAVKLRRFFKTLMLLGFSSLSLALVAIIAAAAFSGPLEPGEEVIRRIIENSHMKDGVTLVSSYELHGNGPFYMSIKAAPFEFLMILTAWLNALFYFVLAWKRDWLVAQLPDAERLDDLSYRTILFAYPFLTMLIITGAVWAYYAWGRYWGWDPKETWSLITWIVYSIYLHVRITHGWEGKIPAAIAAIGFAVVIFTYLGVNILLSGLHSYATG